MRDFCRTDADGGVPSELTLTVRYSLWSPNQRPAASRKRGGGLGWSGGASATVLVYRSRHIAQAQQHSPRWWFLEPGISLASKGRTRSAPVSCNHLISRAVRTQVWMEARTAPLLPLCQCRCATTAPCYTTALQSCMTRAASSEEPWHVGPSVPRG